MLKYILCLLLVVGCSTRLRIESKPSVKEQSPQIQIPEKNCMGPCLEDVLQAAGKQPIIENPGEKYEDKKIEWILDGSEVAFYRFHDGKNRVDIFGKCNEIDSLLRGKKIRITGTIAYVNPYAKDVSITDATLEIIK